MKFMDMRGSWGGQVALFAVALFAQFALAQSTTVTVNANQGPWVQSRNPSFDYGDADNSAPTAVSASSGIPFTPGGTVTVQYVSGQANVYPEGGFPATDANGYSGDATNTQVIMTCGSYPSFFVSSSSYPVYASELIGTFANNGVIVGQPFPVGDGPATFTIPTGANQLLLGVDDDCFYDNTGSWQIKVTYAAGTGSTTGSGGNPGCYQFSGPDATLEMDITSFVSRNDDQPNTAGYTSKDTFVGNNSLTIGGTTQTSQSTSNTPDCVGCLLGSAVFSYANGLTIFSMTVPANDTPGSQDSWFVTLGGVGDLISTGVLPSSTAFPAISSWAINSQITVGMGSNIVSYPVTSISSCSLGGSGGSASSIGAVVSASAFGDFSSVAPGSWVEIYGTNLAPDTRGWGGSDFTGPNGSIAPISLDGVSVSIGGQAAFVDYISPTQVNAQLPSNIATGGALQLTVTNGPQTSAPANLTVNATAPGLLATANFKVGSNQYVVAQHSDGSYVLPTGAIAGVNSRPAQPGETIVIYGVGFGSVTPNIPAGEIVTGENHLSASLQILFGQTAAQLPLPYFGLAPSLVGLYQFRCGGSLSGGQRSCAADVHSGRDGRNANPFYGCAAIVRGGSLRKQFFRERRGIAGEDHWRPVQKAFLLWRSHHLEHGEAQCIGAAAAQAQFFIEASHERALGRVGDVPQGRDESLHACDGGGAAHAVDSIAGGWHAIGHAALREHQHFRAVKIEGLEFERGEQSVLRRLWAAPVGLFENDGRKTHGARSWIKTGQRARGTAGFDRAVFVAANQSVADDVQQGRAAEPFHVLLGGFADGQKLGAGNEPL